MNDKPIYVAFANLRLEKSFDKLKEGKFEDKQLYEFIRRPKEKSNVRSKNSKKNMA